MHETSRNISIIFLQSIPWRGISPDGTPRTLVFSSQTVLSAKRIWHEYCAPWTFGFVGFSESWFPPAPILSWEKRCKRWRDFESWNSQCAIFSPQAIHFCYLHRAHLLPHIPATLIESKSFVHRAGHVTSHVTSSGAWETAVCPRSFRLRNSTLLSSACSPPQSSMTYACVPAWLCVREFPLMTCLQPKTVDKLVYVTEVV